MRKLDGREKTSGIQIVFPRLVNDSYLIVFSGVGVGQNLVEFPRFQGCLVTRGFDADDKTVTLSFGSSL
ncbi:MAG: hypothetical protein ACSLFK_10585 [Gemmatimonadaceae bacterium]